MQVISSKDNEIIKKIRSLKEKKYRDIENSYIIEGIKLVKEAIAEKAKIKQIVICEECLDNEIDKDTLYEIAKYDVIYVTEKVFNLITDVKTPQGIIAVVEKSNNQNQIDYSQDIIVVLDGIQDPGNLGTILRTVDSANLNQMQDNMEDAIVPIKLVSISDTAPESANIGDMYYNTTDNKIYTATAENTWDGGKTPRYDGFYINIETNLMYYYNGTSLIKS